MRVERRVPRQQAGNPQWIGVDPLRRFQDWRADWVARCPADPAAVVLATVGPDGRPTARYVDLARVDTGFVFFTSYRSRKATDLAVHPYAELCFGWLETSRQVRVNGPVERLDPLASDEYYSRLPRPVQLLAWSTDQRSVLDEPLTDRIVATERRFAGQEIPRPTQWGGLRLLPEQIEFWQGGPAGAPERLRYRRTGDGWAGERIAP
ncbi:pyridoxal 5'-phosphate synthase [Verrucosispora sp. WMMA2121]|uniref:pyridoxine/pyridoxamine 5'-phosphate oxidase n=1 Tax=Verrucosispora sp. WMMA2121 TaxID=3015164 RepID=UPI0022B6B0B8|nr:pyridoxal 5'-phosphate synthase [Verrucosispora sp. WMMA2121]MCZ7421220.1 pyridoxal 5'-phosphate synthase [Verrucosispora sp. WMMA2121]